MKNSKTIIGTLSFILLVSFGCKKDKEVKLETKETFSVAMQKSTLKGENENAILVGSKADLEATFSGKSDRVFLRKVGKTNNVFTPVVGPVDPVNPMELCWDEINAYYADHIQAWQAIANQNCAPYVTCITCPNAGGGLYVMYAIKPTSIKCTISAEAAVMYNFTKFDFTVDQYDGEAVFAVINPKR